MRKLLAIMIVTLLAGLVQALDSSPAIAKTYKWKMHTYVPETVNIYQGYMLPLIKELKKRSNGQLEIIPYPVNAIVAPSELLVATAEGVIECAMSTTGYDTGIIPEAYAATSLPYGWTDTSQPADFWYNNEEAWGILDRAYTAKNVKLVALLNPDDPVTFLTMFPINKVSDFKGRLVRSSGNWSLLVTNTGASQVNMNLSDVYMSLEKGVIDGALIAVSGLDDFKWNEIVKYVMMPPVLISGGADIIVNLDAFNELTPELQKIFMETAREMDSTHLIPYTKRLNSKTIATAMEKGVEFITFPESEVANMHKAALGMWEDIESINNNTAREMELLKEYLDSKNIVYPASANR